MRLVQRSWQVAAARAMADYGIEVEYVDAVRDADAGASPSFARRVRLESFIEDPFGRALPTVGEVLRRGAEAATGEWIILGLGPREPPEGGGYSKAS